MENITPKGIIVEELIDSSIRITTEKRELVFPDFFVLFFVLFGFCMLSFSIIANGFNEIPLFFYIAASILLCIILLNLISSIMEIFTITISESTIEIKNKLLFFGNIRTLKKSKIDKIDLKPLTLTLFSDTTPLIMFRIGLTSGPYEVPRILYDPENIYLLKYHKKEIRIWLVKYLTNLWKDK